MADPQAAGGRRTGPPAGRRARIFELAPRDAEAARAAVRAAADAVRRGELIVFPTDTVYGIAARPDDPAATARLFEAKRRPEDLNLPVLVATAVAAWEVATPTDSARRLAAELWPGGLTLVLPRTAQSRPWSLGRRGDTVAVRVPGDPLTGALLEQTGPLAATSANLSGEPPLDDRDALREAFGDRVAVYLIAPAASLAPAGSVVAAGSLAPAGGRDASEVRASTVVDLTGPEPRILREGAVPAARVLAVASSG